jgi:hypothetical protein
MTLIEYSIILACASVVALLAVVQSRKSIQVGYSIVNLLAATTIAVTLFASGGPKNSESASKLDYGPFSTLIKSTGWLIASSVAVGLAWRRRSKWEPSEEDVSGGPAKLGGLLAAVGLAIIWSQFVSPEKTGALVSLSLWAAGLSLLCLLLYGFITAVSTYRETEVGKLPRNIIGGFWLTEEARRGLAKSHSMTLQQLFQELGTERTWPRSSRALSKTCFVTMYLGLTVAGSVALTCAGGLVWVTNDAEFKRRPECPSFDFHGMPMALFTVCSENWSHHGIWPYTLTMNNTSQGLAFAGAFEAYAGKRPFKYNLSKASYLAERRRQDGEGNRPEHISVLNTTEGAKFTTIWTAKAEQSRDEIDLSESQFDRLDQQSRMDGFVLADIAVYEDQGVRISAIWVRKSSEGYKVEYKLTRDEFKTELSEKGRQNYQLTSILAYPTVGDYRYGGIWEKSSKPTFYKWDQDGHVYQGYYDEQVAQKHYLYQIISYGSYYASIWRNYGGSPAAP